MRRRPRIDLGQEVSSKETARLYRKRQKWIATNKGRPESENPFLIAIKPAHENYGEPDEVGDELKARIENLEFGNFPGYFNYRTKAVSEARSDPTEHEVHSNQESHPLQAGLSDERIKLMRGEWFGGKDVLDIGCNRGHITYAIARLFSPKFILGIDIDLKMIQMANRDLHLHLEEDLLEQSIEFRLARAERLYLNGCRDNSESEEAKDEIGNEDKSLLYSEDEDHFPLASYISHGPLAVALSGDKMEKTSSDHMVPSYTNTITTTATETSQPWTGDSRPCKLFPNNILFVEHNYVPANDELVEKQRAFFDTIVCLSVTKWIHLNYRDSGLKRFFRRIYKHLRQDGILILEAQPFDNYGRRRKLSDRLRANYYSIKLRPEQFDEYLLGPEIGFKRILYSTITDHQCAGFKRPLKVFQK